MEKPSEVWVEDEPKDSCDSELLFSYLQTNQDRLQELKKELIDIRLPISAIARILRLPETFIDSKDS